MSGSQSSQSQMIRSYSIRPAVPADVEATFAVRGSTRQNAIPRARLALLGIAPATVLAEMADKTYCSWVCESENAIIGFCNARTRTGEVIVLAVLAGFQGLGVGKALLRQATEHLRLAGCERLWLIAGTDSALRSYGFYRASGRSPTGRLDAHGDEELAFVGGKKAYARAAHGQPFKAEGFAAAQLQR